MEIEEILKFQSEPEISQLKAEIELLKAEVQTLKETLVKEPKKQEPEKQEKWDGNPFNHPRLGWDSFMSTPEAIEYCQRQKQK